MLPPHVRTLLGAPVLVLSLVLVACAPTPEISEGRPADDVCLLDDAPGISLEVFEDRLELRGDTSSLGIGAGTVVVSGVGSGVLRRVTSVDPRDGLLVLGTEAATLTDALVDAQVAVQMQGGKADGVSGLTFDGAARGVGNGLVFGRGGVDVNVTEASFGFDPAFDLDLDISRGSLESFSAVAHGDLDARVAMDVTVEAVAAGAQYSIDIWKRDYVFVQWVGGIPVVETVALKVSAGVRIESDIEETINVSLGGAAYGSVAAGAEFADGAWDLVGENTIAFSALPTTVTGEGSMAIRAFIEATVVLKFYGVVGPGIGIAPYVGLDRTNGVVSRRVGVVGEWRGVVSLPLIDDAWIGVQGRLFDAWMDFPSYEEQPLSAPGMCTNTCPYAGDGECDDGGALSSYAICDLGTDCGDCGPR